MTHYEEGYPLAHSCFEYFNLLACGGRSAQPGTLGHSSGFESSFIVKVARFIILTILDLKMSSRPDSLVY